jgi:uncharacterized protein (DUF1810 family)
MLVIVIISDAGASVRFLPDALNDARLGKCRTQSWDASVTRTTSRLPTDLSSIGGNGLVVDPYRLSRFVEVQDRQGNYARALEEIRAGRKSTHWIWYVFPQLTGLSSSATGREYSIHSLEEARSYLADPVLGARLREITAAAITHCEVPASEIFGQDDVKFRSSMTLFVRADPNQLLFVEALKIFFDAAPDTRTDEILRTLDHTPER